MSYYSIDIIKLFVACRSQATDCHGGEDLQNQVGGYLQDSVVCVTVYAQSNDCHIVQMSATLRALCSCM